MLNSLVNALISGIILAGLYAVMSMGLTLIYGVGRIFNFAHGFFILWGGYLVWFCSVKYEMHYGLAALLVISCAFLSGYLIDRVLLYPLRRRENFAINSVLATLGLAILMEGSGDVIFGTRIKTIDKIVDGTLIWGQFGITYHDIVSLGITIAVLLALEAFLRRSVLGTAMRAISQDTDGAKIVGINVDALYSFTFGLSASLAAVSGILIAPRYFIASFVGWETLFKAIIIVIFGGLGSVRGTFISALILGMLEAFVSMYLGMFWVQPMWFILLIVVLFVRPMGLYGEWA